jgi:hypothetical protein
MAHALGGGEARRASATADVEDVGPRTDRGVQNASLKGASIRSKRAASSSHTFALSLGGCVISRLLCY